MKITQKALFPFLLCTVFAMNGALTDFFSCITASFYNRMAEFKTSHFDGWREFIHPKDDQFELGRPKKGQFTFVHHKAQSEQEKISPRLYRPDTSYNIRWFGCPKFEKNTFTHCHSKEEAICKIRTNIDTMIENFMKNWQGFAFEHDASLFYVHLYESSIKLALEMANKNASFEQTYPQFPDNSYILGSENHQLIEQFGLDPDEGYSYFVESLQNAVSKKLPTLSVLDYKEQLFDKFNSINETLTDPIINIVEQKATEFGITKDKAAQLIGLDPFDRSPLILAPPALKPHLCQSRRTVAEYWFSKQYFFEKPFAILTTLMLGIKNVHNTTISSRFTDGQILKTTLMGVAAATVGIATWLWSKKKQTKKVTTEMNQKS